MVAHIIILLSAIGSSGSDKKEAESKLGASSALPKIIVAGYNALSLCYFFTSGPDEVGAWTIRVSCHEHSSLPKSISSNPA